MPADVPANSPEAIETLIERCLQGDQTAWDAVVMICVRLLALVLMRM